MEEDKKTADAFLRVGELNTISVSVNDNKVLPGKSAIEEESKGTISISPDVVREGKVIQVQTYQKGERPEVDRDNEDDKSDKTQTDE